MSSDYRNELQNKLNSSKKHNYFTIPAGIIAGVLLTLTPNQEVQAQTNLTPEHLEEFQSLYNEFQSILHTSPESTADVETEESTEEVSLVVDHDEIKLIKDSLLIAIEKTGASEIVAELESADLTIDQLEILFEDIVTQLVATENEEEGSATAIEVPNLEDVETEEVEIELEEQEETIESEIIEEPVIDEEPVKTIDPEISEVPNVEEKEEVKNEVAEVDRIMTPMVARASVASAEPETTYYVVKGGDNLNSIARLYGTTADHLQALNNLANKNVIYVGQKLIVTGDVVEIPTEDLSQIGKKLTNAEFIEVISDHAKVIAKENNLYASVMVAQAALESGFGSSGLSSAPNHNLFGIKGSYNGQSVTMKTSEYYNGWIKVDANFKKYPSYKESLLDNAYLLRNGTSWNSTYYNGTWTENASSYLDATAWLQGRYATDPSYASKLNNIISRYNLTQYDMVQDVVAPPVSTPEPTPTPQPEKPVVPSSATDYKVKSGDTLSRIALDYGMTVANLKQLNNLKSDTIYIGQTLKVKAEASKPVPAPAPTPTPAPKPIETPTTAGSYTVKSGDTLSHIALDTGMTVANLKQLNNLKSDTIYIGQTLKVETEASKPAPAPAPAPTPAPKPVETPTTAGSYTVKAGDTLSHIALDSGMTVANLKQLNNLKSDTIYIGQTLKVKAEASKPAPAPTPAPKPVETPAPAGSYTVKSGDTLSRIALDSGMTVANLKQLNNLKSDTIYIGQTLKVKAEASKPAPKPTPAPAPKPVETPMTSSYKVKSDDTLSHIARANNMTVAALKQLNNLKSDLIFIGQTLNVKGQITAPVSKPVSPTSSASTYSIKAGDTLSHIARANNMTVAALKQLNNLKSDLIFVGQSLKVSNTTTKPDTPSNNNANASSSKTYRIVSGDTLSGIAVRNNTTVNALKSNNNLKSDLIFVGQTIRL